MQLHTWLLFALTAIGMSLAPGPNGLLALTHGALHGRDKTLFTIAGGLVGFTAVIALCVFGLGALIQSSTVWLTLLKWCGGAYLVWLGIKLWRSPPLDLNAGVPTCAATSGALFWEGLLCAATNPKGILFFGALLPQFIDPHRDLFTQFAIIALTYAVTEFTVEYLIATAAHRVRKWLAKVGKGFNRACGGGFIAIGALLPLRS